MIRHCLAPVRHGEIRIDGLGFSERLRREIVLEAVEVQHTANEVFLRGTITTTPEIDLPQVAVLRCGVRGPRRHSDDENQGESDTCTERYAYPGSFGNGLYGIGKRCAFTRSAGYSR